MAGKTNPGVEHRGDMGTVFLCLSPCFSTGMNKGTDTKGPSPQAYKKYFVTLWEKMKTPAVLI